VVVSKGTFDERNLERLARAELGKRPRRNFTQLVVYGDRGGAPLPKPAHTTYDYWRGLYDSASRGTNQIAEMISIGGNAVLRIHDTSGKVIRRVLAGRDPLKLDVSGQAFEIVYLSFTAPSPYILQRIDVYLSTSGPLSEEAGLRLLQSLQPIFPDLEVALYIRNDSWFIYQPTYPFANPFSEDLNPPSVDEYSKTRTLRCGRWSGVTSCRTE
jgi:hypothetical protein